MYRKCEQQMKNVPAILNQIQKDIARALTKEEVAAVTTAVCLHVPYAEILQATKDGSLVIKSKNSDEITKHLQDIVSALVGEDVDINMEFMCEDVASTKESKKDSSSSKIIAVQPFAVTGPDGNMITVVRVEDFSKIHSEYEKLIAHVITMEKKIIAAEQTRAHYAALKGTCAVVKKDLADGTTTTEDALKLLTVAIERIE